MSRVFDNTQTGVNETNALTPSNAVYNSLPKGTISLWVYQTAAVIGAASAALIVKDPAGTYSTNLIVFQSGGSNFIEGAILDTLGNRAVADVASALPLNTWTNVILTYDFTGDKKPHVFIGGVEATYTTQTAVVSSTPKNDAAAGWMFGNDTFDDGLTGRLAEIAIWNTVLTGAQIAAVAAATTGVSAIQAANLVGYWHLCGLSSPELDVTANGDNAVLSANPPTSGPNSPGFTCVATKSISGNAGAAGVLVSATGTVTGSTTSGADGTYILGGLIAGAYTITPTLAGATFTPASRPETIVASDLTGVNFVAQASVFSPSPLATDDFHRADSPTLGANWTTATGADSLAIVSTLAVPNSGSLFGDNLYTGENFSNNQRASVTINTFGISSLLVVFVRTEPAETTGYPVFLSGDGAGNYTLDLQDTVGAVTLGVDFPLPSAPQAGDIVSVQAVGTLVTAFYNGVAVISGTSSTTASGSPAFELGATAVQSDTSGSLFTAGAEVFSISGSAGAGGAGATITLSGAASGTTTAAGGTGNYSFAGLAPGTYIVTPGLAGKEFSPTNRTVVITAADVSGVNFLVFTPSKTGSNSENIIASGPIFATKMISPRTSIIGTNLGIKILR